jgi:hypothetical protein
VQQRINAKNRGDRRQYNMEKQKQVISELNILRSAKRRISDKNGPGHIYQKKRKSKNCAPQHQLLMGFAVSLNDMIPTKSDQYGTDNDKQSA